MNILTFDIEEWFLEKEYFGNRYAKYQEYDRCLKTILDILDEKSIKATFMCVGKLAKYNPEVVKLISDKGHEIGCHSNSHIWLNTLTPEQLRTDTKEAVSCLEEVTGKKVLSYRAPAFSIGENNKWAFEILAENGIERDSSVFPASRDFGGFVSYSSEKPGIIKFNGISIKEFPICTTKILGKSLAYSGGGYFRFFPVNYVIGKMNANDYSIAYFHMADVVRLLDKMMTKEEHENYFKETGSYSNRLKRYIKQNLGVGGAFKKMCTLISSCYFVNLEEADKILDWENAPEVVMQ